MANYILPVIWAFRNRVSRTISNTSTDGNHLYLWGNMIAKWAEGGLWITDCGWDTLTTRERLNHLPGVSIQRIKGITYLNGRKWNGEWTRVSDGYQKGKEEQQAEDTKALKMVGAIASLGNIFAENDPKARNNWKLRMIKAGLPGLDPPEDWDTLSEEEKGKRLDKVIEELKKG